MQNYIMMMQYVLKIKNNKGNNIFLEAMIKYCILINNHNDMIKYSWIEINKKIRIFYQHLWII